MRSNPVVEGTHNGIAPRYAKVYGAHRGAIPLRPAHRELQGRVVFLVWTPRGDDAAHLISCRYADRKETDDFFSSL